MLSKASLILFVSLIFSEAAVAQTCRRQSCDIADASGSTGRPITSEKVAKLNDVTDEGRRCIEQNYLKINIPIPPNYKPLINVPAGYTGKAGWWTGRRKQRRAIMSSTLPEPVTAAEDSLEKRQGGCKPYTLLWARGTGEPGIVNDEMGIMFGPMLKDALDKAQPGRWAAHGVAYNSDLAGILCIGMPGGVSCMQRLNQLHNQCPQTKFVVGGFSQGAMVAHECVAFADQAARRQVAGVVTMGDPFNGAQIRDFPSQNIKTFCDATDGVCGGELAIGIGHAAYAFGNTINDAVNWIRTKTP